MEEKRKDLISSQQKKVLDEMIAKLNETHPSFYYLSTIEVAAEIKRYMHEKNNISREKYNLIKDLSREDIQILLSFHDQ